MPASHSAGTLVTWSIWLPVTSTDSVHGAFTMAPQPPETWLPTNVMDPVPDPPDNVSVSSTTPLPGVQLGKVNVDRVTDMARPSATTSASAVTSSREKFPPSDLISPRCTSTP